MALVSKLCLVSVVLVAFVVFSFVAGGVLAQGGREVAASAVSEAERSVALGFEAVLSAEEAGANVTGLVVRLNEAAGLFSDAQRAFDAGDYENATSLAELSVAAGGLVWDDAERLEVEAVDAASARMWLFLVASSVAVPLVLLVGFFGYRFFKRWYYGRLLRMKPRVGKA